MFLTIIKSSAKELKIAGTKSTMGRLVCNVAFSVLFCAWITFPPGTSAQTANGSPDIDALKAAARQEAAKILKEAEARFKEDPKNPEHIWQLGRACFDLAEFPKDKREQADLAERGISLCKDAVALVPTNAAAQYYLGLNYGQLSRTKGIGALRIVSPMQKAFELCITLDETYDNAGPHRNLGYLFRDAPSWAGIGDRVKARYHLERAVKLAPNHVENHLALLEGRIKWGEKDKGKAELTRIRELWPEAKTKAVTPAQKVAWAEWEELLQRLSNKLR